LVKNIAKQEGVSFEELDKLHGTGKEGRVTKNDILAYIENRPKNGATPKTDIKQASKTIVSESVVQPILTSADDEVIEMTRMGKLIASHMVNSVQTSAHVQSFIEVDVTKIVKWRNEVKEAFLKREGEKITFTPIFMQAVAMALKEFPLLNISVEDDKIIKHKNINLGMATALADGNLIVPVIKNADQLNLVGMTKSR